MPEGKIAGTDVASLKSELLAGRVKSEDVLVLTYDNGDKMEVLYVEDAPYLKAASDTPEDIWRRRTFARGCVRDEGFVAWERKGALSEFYSK